MVQADQPGAGDAVRGPLRRFIGDEGIVLGVDDQGRRGERFQREVVHVRVGDERVEGDAFGLERDWEEAVDQVGDDPVVGGREREALRDPDLAEQRGRAKTVSAHIGTSR